MAESNAKRALVIGVAWVSVLLTTLAGLAACQSAPAPPPTATATAEAVVAPLGTSPPGVCEMERFAQLEGPTETPSSQVEAPTVTFSPGPTDTPAPPPTWTPTATTVPTPDADLIRGPYLQSVTADSITVVWETDRPTHGTVAYGETGTYGLRVADPAVGTRHAVSLTSLAPYTAYHYRVESGGAPLSEDATFRTAAGSDQTRFTFAVFGDTRTGHQFHRAVVARMVEAAPDFVLHTGDLVANGSIPDHWDTLFKIEQALLAHTPLFLAMGNHERNDALYADGRHPSDLFYLPGNERWYTFDYGNARFVCLQVNGYGDFSPGSQQYAWLVETLAANTQPWLFVFFHVPPYSSVQDALEADVRGALVPLFERYGVDVVFNGHHHNYERNEMNGVTYVVSAGGGAPLYAAQEREPTQAAFALAYHFVLVEVDGDHLKATAISNDGDVLDEFDHKPKLDYNQKRV